MTTNDGGLTKPKRRSTLESITKVAKDNFHLGLQTEISAPPTRSLNDQGKSFYVRHTAGTCEQIRLLVREACNDLKSCKKSRIFSPYDSEQVLKYFDGVISLVSVFLYEQLGWENAINIKENPTPVLLALLCFFHIMIFWVNTHHYLKFSPDTMGLRQVWCMAFFCLGLVVYPLSLAIWIEEGDSSSYYYINTGCCLIFLIFNILTPVDERANDLFRLYHKAAPAIATIFYGIATILHWQGIVASKYMVYIAPFCFVLPVGGQSKNTDTNDNEEENATNIFIGALNDFKSGNFLSPYPASSALDYFDAVVGLATVFIFIADDGPETLGGAETGISNGLLAALLCFFHVVVYWINIHQSLKFSPPTMSILQVWSIVFFSLGMVFIPLCITAWIEDGAVDIYYIINLAMCGFFVLFSFLTQIERGRANALFRLWHKLGPIAATTWYGIAFTLLSIGKEQRWMIIVAPFCFMMPLGGALPESTDDIELPPEKDDESSFEDNEYRVSCNKQEQNEYGWSDDGHRTTFQEEHQDQFFDCDSD